MIRSWFTTRNLSQMRSEKRDWMLLFLAGSLLVIFGIFQFISEESLREFYKMNGVSRPGMKAGYIWQIVTYSLLHGSWIHLVINVLPLLGLGQRLIWMIDRKTCFKVLLSGILLGAFFHLLSPGNTILVGISGGVCAILSCLTSLAPDGRMWPLPISGKNISLGFFTATAALAIIGPALSLMGMGDAYETLPFSRISHLCHLGGLTAGWLYAKWLLRDRVTLESLQKDRLKRESKR